MSEDRRVNTRERQLEMVRSAIEHPVRVQVALPRIEGIGNRYMYVRPVEPGWFGVVVVQREEFGEAVTWRHHEREADFLQWCDDMLGHNEIDWVSPDHSH